MTNESLVKQVREVQDFNHIILRDFGNLFISQGSEESLIVEAEKETLQKVITEVKDRKLKLKIGSDWIDRIRTGLTTSLNRQRINFYLTVKELAGLEIFGMAKVEVSPLETDNLLLNLGGAADINMDNLKAEQLKVLLSGTGTITIKGNVTEQKININGAGNYRAIHLISKNAKITVNGTGNAKIWVTDHLKAAINGIGDIGYRGSPVVHQSVSSGIGQIKKIEPEKV